MTARYEPTVEELAQWFAMGWRQTPNLRPAEEYFAAGLCALTLRDADHLGDLAHEAERQARWLVKNGKPHHVREMATAAMLCREARRAIEGGGR